MSYNRIQPVNVAHFTPSAYTRIRRSRLCSAWAFLSYICQK